MFSSTTAISFVGVVEELIESQGEDSFNRLILCRSGASCILANIEIAALFLIFILTIVSSAMVARRSSSNSMANREIHLQTEG